MADQECQLVAQKIQKIEEQIEIYNQKYQELVGKSKVRILDSVMSEQ